VYFGPGRVFATAPLIASTPDQSFTLARSDTIASMLDDHADILREQILADRIP
jgi:hypothetical protein